MLSVDILWNLSQNKSENWWRQKTGPATLMASSPMSQNSGLMKPGGISAINRANPSLLGPMDIIMNELPNALSAVAATGRLTSGINLSGTFSNALKPSPFQKTSFSLGPSEITGAISNLASSIFKAAVAAGNLTTEQKSELFTDIAAGVNLGFLSVTELITQLDMMTPEVKKSIDAIKSSIQANLSGFYTKNIFSDIQDRPASDISAKAAVTDTQLSNQPLNKEISPDPNQDPNYEEPAAFTPVDDNTSAMAGDTTEIKSPAPGKPSAPEKEEPAFGRKTDTFRKTSALGAYINPSYL